jgi:hypothetical protein
MCHKCDINVTSNFKFVIRLMIKGNYLAGVILSPPEADEESRTTASLYER